MKGFSVYCVIFTCFRCFDFGFLRFSTGGISQFSCMVVFMFDSLNLDFAHIILVVSGLGILALFVMSYIVGS